MVNLRAIRSISLSAAMLLGVVACSGNGEADGRQYEPTGAPTSATAAEVTVAPADVRRGQRLLAEVATVAWDMTVLFGPSRTDATGVYRFDNGYMEATNSITIPGEQGVEARARVVDGNAYLSLGVGDVDWGDCWLSLANEDIASVSGLPTSVLTEGVAVQPLVAIEARRIAVTKEGTITAVGALGNVARTMGTGFADGLGIPVSSQAEVPLQLSFDDGLVTGWSATAADMVAAATKAGYELSPEIAGQSEDVLAQLFGPGTGVLVNLHDFGAPVTVQRIDPSLIVTGSLAEPSFASEMDACVAGRS